jgi:hypothetical protein
MPRIGPLLRRAQEEAERATNVKDSSHSLFAIRTAEDVCCRLRLLLCSDLLRAAATEDDKGGQPGSPTRRVAQSASRDVRLPDLLRRMHQLVELTDLLR